MVSGMRAGVGASCLRVRGFGSCLFASRAKEDVLWSYGAGPEGLGFLQGFLQSPRGLIAVAPDDSAFGHSPQ